MATDLNLISGAESGLWGIFDSDAELPNVSGAAVQSSFLEVGHLAMTRVTAGAPRLKICTTATLAEAVWNDVAPATHPTRVFNVPLITNAANLAGQGTDAAAAASTDIDYTEMFVPHRMTCTGAAALNGTTVGTDNVIYRLYDALGVFLIATAATLGAGADVFQQIAWSAVQLLEPGLYHVSIAVNGTTHQHQRVSAGQPMVICEREGSHVFATDADITSLATTFTADRAPICYLY